MLSGERGDMGGSPIAACSTRITFCVFRSMCVITRSCGLLHMLSEGT